MIADRSPSASFPVAAAAADSAAAAGGGDTLHDFYASPTIGDKPSSSGAAAAFSFICPRYTTRWMDGRTMFDVTPVSRRGGERHALGISFHYSMESLSNLKHDLN